MAVDLGKIGSFGECMGCDWETKMGNFCARHGLRYTLDLHRLLSRDSGEKIGRLDHYRDLGLKINNKNILSLCEVKIDDDNHIIMLAKFQNEGWDFTNTEKDLKVFLEFFNGGEGLIDEFIKKYVRVGRLFVKLLDIDTSSGSIGEIYQSLRGGLSNSDIESLLKIDERLLYIMNLLGPININVLRKLLDDLLKIDGKLSDFAYDILMKKIDESLIIDGKLSDDKCVNFKDTFKSNFEKLYSDLKSTESRLKSQIKDKKKKYILFKKIEGRLDEDGEKKDVLERAVKKYFGDSGTYDSSGLKMEYLFLLDSLKTEIDVLEALLTDLKILSVIDGTFITDIDVSKVDIKS